jgi:hypothetical protein
MTINGKSRVMSYEDDETDRNAAITALWPYDGPHSAESVTQAAEGISQLARYINNATQGGRRYPYMSTVSRVAASLAITCHGLDQLLNQMKTATEDHARTGDLYDDRDPNQSGSDTAWATAEAIEKARDAAEDLARCLTTVATDANHIGHRDPIR